MNILIIHQSFPAQFVHLAPALQARGHQVRGLGQLRAAIPEVSVPTWWYPYERPKAVSASDTPSDTDAAAPEETLTQSPTGSDYGSTAHRGETVLRFLAARSAEGYRPDVILGHVAWGELLYLRHLWPEAKIVGYTEFLSGPGHPLLNFDPEFAKDDISAYVAGVNSLAKGRFGLWNCNHIIAPTEWQASGFPPEIRAKMSVLHDGVDTDFSSPQAGRSLTLPDGHTIRDGDEVITFASRNLEPLRGYHTFMRALPAVLAARPNLRVVIAGNNRKGYGEAAPKPFSWRDLLLFEVGDQMDMTRLHYTSKLDHAEYTDMLRITRVHTYLTYPYILSWSLIEALSVGALVIGSKTPPVEEVIRHGDNGLLVDFFDPEGLAAQIIDVLDSPERYAPLKPAARASVLAKYDAARICVPNLIACLERIGASV